MITFIYKVDGIDKPNVLEMIPWLSKNIGIRQEDNWYVTALRGEVQVHIRDEEAASAFRLVFGGTRVTQPNE